jgi:hypothetical protein
MPSINGYMYGTIVFDENTWIDTLYGPPMVPIASLRGTYQLNGDILESLKFLDCFSQA